MREDPITALERELVEAARRRATGRRRRRRVNLSGFPAAVLVAVTVAVAAGALILLGGHTRPPVTAAVPGRQQLIDILGVLRRPQTKADLALPILRDLSRGPIAARRGTPDLPLVRFATTTPWGEKLYFVPTKPPTAQQLARFARQHPAFAPFIARRLARGETLGVLSSRGGSGGGNAAAIEAGYSLQTDGAGRSFAGGSTQTRLILVVPDGVAKVVFVLGRQLAGGTPGAPIYAHSLSVSVPVHDNLAAVQVNRECCNGQIPMLWYGAHGQIIKRIGDFMNLNRVIPPPKPGPETPLSRAAERNPSTPNPVWVRPQTGGPHTNFAVHFRVLLNDADYQYTVSGARCPGITFPGGSGGGTNDLRGRIWSENLDAVTGQAWCPGSYHISVTVMDLGRYGPLKHPAHPFGTATFTVHP
jgi:hypothetical protein